MMKYRIFRKVNTCINKDTLSEPMARQTARVLAFDQTIKYGQLKFNIGAFTLLNFCHANKQLNTLLYSCIDK